MDASAPPARVQTAFFQTGFRPFFLAASLFALLSIPLWIFFLAGKASFHPAGGVLFWHAHEMIFGYAVAVIAGFLLTAAARWTDRPTAEGAPLFALVALWSAGRIGFFLSEHLSPWLLLAIDGAFLPALLLTLARPILGARDRRNYPILVLLAGLSFANIWMHGEVCGFFSSGVRAGSHLALYGITWLLLLIGGRIIPLFTRNATRAPGIVSSPVAERIALGSVLALALAEAGQAPPLLLAGLSALLAFSVLFAQRRWGLRASLAHPLLWSLHLGYFWIAIAFLFQCLQYLGAPVLPSSALHAVTIGALGTLTLSMMARVTLGHTGRMIVSSPLTTLSFLCITLAALSRVLLPELNPRWLVPSWHSTAFFWSLAFLFYLLRYTPLLLRPRVDGKPG